MLMRRTPMKRTPFKRAAPATKSHSNQAAALTSQALTAIKTRAPLRASTYAAPTDPAAPIAKSAPVRSEALRRAVALCKSCHQGPLMGWHGQRRMWAIKKMDEVDALAVTIQRLLA